MKKKMLVASYGHPLLEIDKNYKIDVSQIIGKNKALISIFPGSSGFEVITLTPILVDFIKLMNEKYSDFLFVFHSTNSQKKNLKKF